VHSLRCELCHAYAAAYYNVDKHVVHACLAAWHVPAGRFHVCPACLGLIEDEDWITLTAYAQLSLDGAATLKGFRESYTPGFIRLPDPE
jgi:hypothetical protein